ncbi:MAG: protein kinase [Vicinamibacteria bacterium]|nr:protein kinase [Vicinamibacteria bacterium]
MAHPAQIGRYQVIEFLGQGSMGVVYRGRDETLERDVALKVMSLAQSTAEEAQKRFRREAQAAARLQHPNIVTIYELGVHQGAPFIAMELLAGMDLARAIAAGLRPDPRATLPIVLQILAGLGHAHEHGIVHRDIKPSNVFLPMGLPVKIMDFGVARLVDAASTGTGSGIVGSPSYMSPEQIRGDGVDGRSDLFSVGLILFELVTGERAFKADSVAAVLYKITNETPDFRTLPQNDEWTRLRAVLSRALARDSCERYADARSMAADLVQALLDLGGSSDWMSASDRGLLVRSTPRPRALAVDLESEAPTLSDALAARIEKRAARFVPPRWLLVVIVIGLSILLGGLGLILLGRARTRPTPITTMESSSPSEPSIMPVPAPSARIASPSPPPVSLRSPSTPRLVLSPAALAPLPTRARASIARAEAFLTQGHYQRAMDEARAVLALDPYDTEARTLLEDAEAALVVESRLRKAREAMQLGDREAALEEVRAGLAVAPNDGRLLQLFRELTQD